MIGYIEQERPNEARIRFGPGVRAVIVVSRVQDANKARLSGTIFPEDYCHARSEIDLRAGLEGIYAFAHFERVEADGFQRISGELLSLDFRNGLKRFF